MVKNSPSSSRDVGLIPGWGNKIPHALGQLSLYTTTREAHVAQWTILHAAAKTWYSKNKQTKCKVLTLKFQKLTLSRPPPSLFPVFLPPIWNEEGTWSSLRYSSKTTYFKRKKGKCFYWTAPPHRHLLPTSPAPLPLPHSHVLSFSSCIDYLPTLCLVSRIPLGCEDPLDLVSVFQEPTLR